jgi:hypothetical protein
MQITYSVFLSVFTAIGYNILEYEMNSYFYKIKKLANYFCFTFSFV